MYRPLFHAAQAERKPPDRHEASDGTSSSIEQPRGPVALSIAQYLPPLRTLAARTIDVVIVGGSIAGLSAAATAARAGLRALLLEAAPAPALGHGRDETPLLPAVAALAEHARSAGAMLAGEARIISYAEEHGCAGSTHWRLTTVDGVTIPARGLIVACTLPSSRATADADSSYRKSQRLGVFAPGMVVEAGDPRNIDAASRVGHTAALGIVSHLQADARSCESVPLPRHLLPPFVRE